MHSYSGVVPVASYTLTINITYFLQSSFPLAT